MGQEFGSVIIVALVCDFLLPPRRYCEDGGCAVLERLVSQSIEVGPAPSGSGEQDSLAFIFGTVFDAELKGRAFSGFFGGDVGLWSELLALSGPRPDESEHGRIAATVTRRPPVTPSTLCGPNRGYARLV